MDITARRADRIGKNEMLDLYREMYPKRGITTQLLIPKLRNFKIEYDKGIIGNDGTRGCFVGVKIKNSNDDEEDLIINKLYPALDTKEKDNEIKLLKQKLEELEFLLKDKDEEIKKLSKPKEEIKQVITAEIKEEINNDNEEKEKAILKDFIKQQRQEQRQEQKTEDKKEVIEKVVKIKKEKKDKKEKKKKEEIDLDKVFEDPILKQFFN
jgi:hypothetical protein